MALKRKDISALRGLLYSLESDRPMSEATRAEHVDALRRCIAQFEVGDPDSPLWWAAGALKKSVKRIPGNRYMIDDGNLYRWAMTQIFDLVPDPEDVRHAH